MRPAVQQPISKDKNVMVQTREYYLKNHYLTFMSKVKVPGRSLWYTPYGITPPYGPTKVHYGMQHTALWTTYQISLTYLERNNYLTLRSKSNKGHYGMQHTTLWTCTHIPNIIDLSRKKQLFDLEVKVQQRSLWYATHHLMDMHPYTKYH